MLYYNFFGQWGKPYQAPNLSMKVLGWNCRGICNAMTIRALKAQIKGTSPDVIFLTETKASTSRMVEAMSVIKFSDLCVVEAKGAVKGICVMWKYGCSIQQVEYNKNLIAVKVTDAVCEWLLVVPFQKAKSMGESYGTPRILPRPLNMYWGIQLHHWW